MANAPQLQIVDRLQKLPIIHSALDLANNSYAKLKASNGLVGSTLDQAESTVNYVATSARPVLNRFQGQSECYLITVLYLTKIFPNV